jgi:hypothetical protein
MQTFGALPQGVFRGGPDLTPRLGIDVLLERNTGLLRTDRGISLFDDPAKAARFGEVYVVESFPEGLKMQQRGRDPSHYELMPSEPMPFERYIELLTRVILRPLQRMS